MSMKKGSKPEFSTEMLYPTAMNLYNRSLIKENLLYIKYHFDHLPVFGKGNRV